MARNLNCVPFYNHVVVTSTLQRETKAKCKAADLLTSNKGRVSLLEEEKVKEWHQFTIQKICNLYFVEDKLFIDKRKVHCCHLYWIFQQGYSPSERAGLNEAWMYVYESIDLLSRQVLYCRLLKYNSSILSLLK